MKSVSHCLFILLFVSGCITNKALELARTKATPDIAQCCRFERVVSAVKQDNGDISVCAELRGPAGTKESELHTLTLALSSLTEKARDVKSMGLIRKHRWTVSTNSPANSHIFDYYLFPIKETQRGCKRTAPERSSSLSIIPVERKSVFPYNFNLIYNKFGEEQPTKESVYEVTYVSKDYDDDEEKIPSKSKDIYLVYYPPQKDRENTQPIIIAGAYVNKSTNLYYLLVPAAMVGDLAVLTGVVLTGRTWPVLLGGKCGRKGGPNVKIKKWPK